MLSFLFVIAQKQKKKLPPLSVKNVDSVCCYFARKLEYALFDVVALV